jgi:hypothetical protein
MPSLTIEYDGARDRTGRELSLEIDGKESASIRSGESCSFELEEGTHVINARSGKCSKRIEIRLRSDDRFIIAWDWFWGGLTAADERADRYSEGGSLAKIIALIVIAAAGTGIIWSVPLDFSVRLAAAVAFTGSFFAFVMFLTLRRRKATAVIDHR